MAADAHTKYFNNPEEWIRVINNINIFDPKDLRATMMKRIEALRARNTKIVGAIQRLTPEQYKEDMFAGFDSDSQEVPVPTIWPAARYAYTHT